MSWLYRMTQNSQRFGARLPSPSSLMKVDGYTLRITGVVTAGKLSDFIRLRYLGKVCFPKIWHLLIWLKCITNHSLLPEPEQLYKLPKTPKTEKIEDALLCQCPLVSLIICCTSFICINFLCNWFLVFFSAGQCSTKCFRAEILSVGSDSS